MAESRMTQTDSGGCPDESAMLSVQRVERIGESVILYDASLVNHMHEAWFEPAHWTGALHAVGASGGRGTTLFIRCDEQDGVLRHYYRGGLVARLVRDRFLWLGEHRTRSFAEWRLLAHLQAAGLPAPRPLAARYRRHGLVYSADLITVRLPGVVPLATRMARGQVGETLWQQVGACIGRFHAAGVFHADLNAHNVQVSGSDAVFLLDFDRGRLMPGPGGWQARNLQRLQRSLRKVSAAMGRSLAPGDWEALLSGYQQRQPRP
jgi:3-deoxy-D-manno-octulosonic acid kinase